MAVKISVVIPVFNPGSHIDDCIRSRAAAVAANRRATKRSSSTTAQRTGRASGSTRWLPSTPTSRSAHIPNSGWPGRPRNIGHRHRVRRVHLLRRQRRLAGPDKALERLYDFAVENGSDIVVGKVVGHRRMMPKEIFRNSKARAVLGEDPLLTLLTPHKLFRKAMLDEHGIRFPEGPRRLEDHLFVMKAYFAAETISILADYPVYHWVRRIDETNASGNRFDPKGYFHNVREVLDVVEADAPSPVSCATGCSPTGTPASPSVALAPERCWPIPGLPARALRRDSHLGAGAVSAQPGPVPAAQLPAPVSPAAGRVLWWDWRRSPAPSAA